jgi:large subunit ribosomal protein L4
MCSLNPEVFAAKINAALVHDVVRWQRAKRRAGTASTLTRAEMSGGGRKPWKQKGTGRARSGSNTSPIWVGGGVAHGPKPKSYEFRLPKRTRRQALASVLSEKLRTGALIIVDKIENESCKTKSMVSFFQAVGAGDKGRALVIAQKDAQVERSGRNIPKTLTLPVEGVNVFDLMKHHYLICTPEAITEIEQRILQEQLEGEEVAA